MICVFLADGFEDIEAVSVIDILKRADYDVQMVGVGKKEIISASGITVIADIKDEDLIIKNVDAIVLPGGMPGALNLKNSTIVCDTLKYCQNNKKLIAAICAAPFVLGELGLLIGKKATCYPGFENQLIGAELSSASICVDGNIITAKGPGIAINFAFSIVEYLSGKDLAQSIGASMQCV